MKNSKITKYIKQNTLRLEVSYRGGGIEIDASKFLGIKGAKMTAYQNYLGGGIAGAICSDNNIRQELTDTQKESVQGLALELKKYFFTLNNGGGDEYMQEMIGNFESNQKLPRGAY